MAWNNNYSRGSRGNDYNRSGNGYNKRRSSGKKKSGASFGYADGEKDRPFVRGWNIVNGVLHSYIAGPYESKTSKTNRVQSASGKEWENWAVKVTPKGGKSFFVSGMFDVQAKKVIIQELGIVMNPKGGPGGYTGSFYIRKGR